MYLINRRGQPARGDRPTWGLGGKVMSRNVTKGLGLGWVVWNDQRETKWKRYLKLEYQEAVHARCIKNFCNV
jgi:hypothetical protein